MKNSLILYLTFSLFLFVSHKCWSNDLDKMEVKTVSKNLIVANKGKTQGVHINEVYSINREGNVIGKAKVLLIEDNLCGLKILQLQPGFFVKNGDVLIKNRNNESQKSKKGYIFRPPKPIYCIYFFKKDENKIST